VSPLLLGYQAASARRQKDCRAALIPSGNFKAQRNIERGSEPLPARARAMCQLSRAQLSGYQRLESVPVCSVRVVHAASGAALAGIEWT